MPHSAIRVGPSLLLLTSTIVLCALVYLPAVNRVTLWEDNELITGAAIGDSRSIADCFSRPFLYNYYRPLTSISFFAERWFAGENPLVRHFTNLLLHLLTIPVVFALLYAAFQSLPAANAGAFLFAFQPVQMLPTAWIGGRTDTLCVLFASLFAWALIASVRSAGRQRIALVLGSLLAYAAAVLAKEQALVLLFLVPIAYRCFADRPGSWKTGLANTIPYVLAAIAFSAAWFILVPQIRQELPSGAADTVYRIGQTMCYFGAAFIVPTPAKLYTISLGSYEGMFYVTAGLLVLAGGLFLTVLLMRSAPNSAWFLAFSLIAILPVCGLLPMASLPVGPYRAALSGIGMAGFLAWLFTSSRNSRKSDRKLPATYIGAGVGITYAAVCTWLIAWGLSPFQSAVQINQTFVKINPDSVFAKLELSESLLNKNELNEASSIMNGLAYRRPAEDEQTQDNQPQVYRLNMGDYDRYFARLYTNLAYKRYSQGDTAAAKRALDVAKFMVPEDSYVNLGVADYSIAVGDISAACTALRNALYADQSLTEKRMELARLLIKLGRFDAARNELQECVRRNANLKDAYLLLAESEWKSGNPGGARVAMERGVRAGALTSGEAETRLSSQAFENKQ